MALPQNTLSTDTANAAFEYPRDVWKIPLVDYEIGGVAVGDTSQGISVKLWKASVNEAGTQILLEAEDVPASVFVTDTDITEVSLAFDVSMRPYFAWMAGGVSKYRWFDPNVSGFVTSSLDVGAVNPRICLDDKRPFNTSNCDVILAYLLDGSLMYRQQRERFQTERELEGYLSGYELVQIGMNRGGRFQFQVRP